MGLNTNIKIPATFRQGPHTGMSLTVSPRTATATPYLSPCIACGENIKTGTFRYASFNAEHANVQTQYVRLETEHRP